MSTTSLVGTSASITITSKSDSSKTVSIPITLHDSIQFPTAKPPDGLCRQGLHFYTFAASGGTGMLSYQLAEVTALPAGLTLCRERSPRWHTDRRGHVQLYRGGL